MNVLFIGRFYSKEILKTIVEDTNGKVAFSNHNFEISLIKGFAAQKDINLRVITAPLVFSYPHNNKRIRIKADEYIEGNINIKSIGFNNIVGYNILSTKKNLIKAFTEELEKFDDSEVFIVVNTPSLVISSALFKVINCSEKKITTTLIIPDVPECMLEMNGKLSLKGRILQIINKKTAKLACKYDKYVFLTEAMNEFYHADENDFIVMEGLIDDNAIITYKGKEELSASYKDKEIILYSGTLRSIFGIMELVEVFEKGKFPNTELWICGSGECSEEITERAKQNPSIKYWGLVDSDEARQLQSRATILANPRSADRNYTKYSFPSKTIEYMLAGKSIIMNHLPGIPKEYDQYLFYPENESTEAWISQIRNILEMDSHERQKKAIASQYFILSNKLSSNQCARIIELAQHS